MICSDSRLLYQLQSECIRLQLLFGTQFFMFQKTVPEQQTQFIARRAKFTNITFTNCSKQYSRTVSFMTCLQKPNITFITPTENTDVKDFKQRNRTVQNYHKSLENLSDQFWKSVERASSPLGRSTSKFRDLYVDVR